MGQKILDDPKKFFDFVNVKRKCKNLPSVMHYNNTTSSNPLVIANLSKQRFQEVYHSTNNNVTNYSNFNYAIDQPPLISSMNISEDEIITGFLHLKPDKVADPDSIPTTS